MYRARDQGIEYWLAMDSLLGAALGEAMIGGEGDPSRIGLGSKAMRLAAGAVANIFAVVAEALDLAPPAIVEHVSSQKHNEPSGGGELAVGLSQSYHWQLGLAVAQANPPAQRVSQVAKSVSQASEAGFDASLESARAALERIVRKTVAFGPAAVQRLASPAMPQGWLRLGMPTRGRGAVILTADAPSATALLSALLGQNVAERKNPGVLAQTGAETIMLNILQAFVASLPYPPEEERRAMRLTDDAILPSLPHHAIEHDFRIQGWRGRLGWLVPSQQLAAQ